MNSYLPKFRSLMFELQEHKNIVLLDYKEFEGIKLDSYSIYEIEEIIGFKIPPTVLDFYAESDGLRMSWVHKEDPFYDPYMHVPYEPPQDLNLLKKGECNMSEMEGNHESGSINIRCLYDVFMSDFPVNPDLCDDGFYVFDSFSMIHGAAISFPNSKEEPIVSFNTDYYTHFDDYSNAMHFTQYLDFLIKSKGIKTLRANQDKIALLNQGLDHWPDSFYYCEY